MSSSVSGSGSVTPSDGRHSPTAAVDQPPSEAGLCGVRLLVPLGDGDGEPELGLAVGVELVGPLGVGSRLGVGLFWTLGLGTGRALGEGGRGLGSCRRALGVAVGDFCDGRGRTTWSGLGGAVDTAVPEGTTTGAPGRVPEELAVGVGWVTAS